MVASSPSLVRSTNRDHSCLSVLDIVGSCSELVRSELICLELASILWINSLLIRMAADSKESPASFSASHQAFIWSLLGFVPGKVSFMFTWKALGPLFCPLGQPVWLGCLSVIVLWCGFSPGHGICPGLFFQHQVVLDGCLWWWLQCCPFGESGFQFAGSACRVYVD